VGVAADALGNAYVAGSRFVGEGDNLEDWQAFVYKVTTLGTVLWEVASTGSRGKDPTNHCVCPGPPSQSGSTPARPLYDECLDV
jgi:hypothetical protein